MPSPPAPGLRPRLGGIASALAAAFLWLALPAPAGAQDASTAPADATATDTSGAATGTDTSASSPESTATTPKSEASAPLYTPLNSPASAGIVQGEEPLPELGNDSVIGPAGILTGWETPDQPAPQPITPLMPVLGPFGLGGSFNGFRAGAIVSAIYDSNLFQYSSSELALAEDAGQATSGMIFTAGPILGYHSPGPLWIIEADYAPTYVHYMDYDSLSGFDQNMKARLRYERHEWKASIESFFASNRQADQSLAQVGQSAISGGEFNATSAKNSLDREGLTGEDYGVRLSVARDGPRLDANVNGSYAFSSGGNRYYGADVTENIATLSGRATYKLSAKTTLEGMASFNQRTPEETTVTTSSSASATTTQIVNVTSTSDDGTTTTTTAVPSTIHTQSDTTSTSQPYRETTTSSAQLAALWEFTPLLSIGPGARLGYDAQSTWEDTRTSLGPIIRASYKLSHKIRLDAQLGADFYSYSGGKENTVTGTTVTDTLTTNETLGVSSSSSTSTKSFSDGSSTSTTSTTTTSVASDTGESTTTTTRTVTTNPGTSADESTQDSGPFISGGLTASYALGENWSANLSFTRSSQTDGTSSGTFREVLATRAGINHRFAQATVLSLGLGYQMENPLDDTPTTTSSSSTERQYLTFNSTLSFPIWKDRAVGAIFFRYRDQQGDYGTGDWNGYQTGIRAMISF